MSCLGSTGYHRAPRASLTLGAANTDVAFADVIPEGTRRIILAASALSFVAFGEATTAAIGLAVPSAQVVTIDLMTPAGGDAKLHAQSPTASAVVYATYLS